MGMERCLICKSGREKWKVNIGCEHWTVWIRNMDGDGDGDGAMNVDMHELGFEMDDGVERIE